MADQVASSSSGIFTTGRVLGVAGLAVVGAMAFTVFKARVGVDSIVPNAVLTATLSPTPNAVSVLSSAAVRSDSYTAVVFGSTGAIGAFLVQDLAASPLCSTVVAVTRRPVEAHAQPGIVEVVVPDFDELETNADLAAAFEEHKPAVAFSALGTTARLAGSQKAFRRIDFGYNMAAARAAKAANVEHYSLVSSMGADPTASLQYPYTKGQMEEQVAALDFPRYSVWRPSLLIATRPDMVHWETAFQVLFPMISPIFVGPLRHYKEIKVEKVAHALRLECERAVAVPRTDLYRSGTIHDIVAALDD